MQKYKSTLYEYRKQLFQMLNQHMPWDYFITINFYSNATRWQPDLIDFVDLQSTFRKWDQQLNQQLLGKNFYYDNKLNKRFRFIGVPETLPKRAKQKKDQQQKVATLFDDDKHNRQSNADTSTHLHVHMKIKIPNNLKTAFVDNAEGVFNKVVEVVHYDGTYKDTNIKIDIQKIKDDAHDKSTNWYTAESYWQHGNNNNLLLQYWLPEESENEENQINNEYDDYDVYENPLASALGVNGFDI